MAPARAEDAPPGAPPAPGTATLAPPAPPAQASAQCVFERYVSVAAAAGFDLHLADEVRKDLAAELAPRGFGVCPSQADHGELVAAVTLVQREPALVAIQVEDYTTGKRVARDVRLARIPAGGVALALAIAADELLRASWAELVLRRREAEAEASAAQVAIEANAASSEVEREVSPQKRAARLPAAVALVADYAHAAADWDAFGLDLRLQLRPFRYGLVEIGGGGVSALPVETELGTARAAGALALLTLGGCAEPDAHVVLCAGARGSFQWTRFRGSDAQDAEARRADLTSFVLSAVAQVQTRISPHFFLLAELALGGALLSARATSMGETLIGIEGFVLGAALGAGYAP